MEVMTQVQARVPELHRGTANDAKPPGDRIAVPLVPSDPLAGLTAWNKTDGYLPCTSGPAFGDLYVCRDADHLYLGLHADDYLDTAVYAGKAIPSEDFMEWTLRLGEKQESVSIRFASGGKATVSDPETQIRYNDRGIRQTIIACVPLSPFKDATHNAAQPVRLQSGLNSYCRLMRMAWDQNLALQDR
jgi:hypothetical protein